MDPMSLARDMAAGNQQRMGASGALSNLALGRQQVANMGAYLNSLNERAGIEGVELYRRNLYGFRTD